MWPSTWPCFHRRQHAATSTEPWIGLLTRVTKAIHSIALKDAILHLFFLVDYMVLWFSCELLSVWGICFDTKSNTAASLKTTLKILQLWMGWPPQGPVHSGNILFQVENYVNCQTYFQWDSALLIYKNYFPVSTLTCHTGWGNGKTDMLQKKELSTLLPQPLHLTFKQLAFGQWDWIRFWNFFPLKPHTESISPLSSPLKTQSQPKKKPSPVKL